MHQLRPAHSTRRSGKISFPRKLDEPPNSKDAAHGATQDRAITMRLPSIWPVFPASGQLAVWVNSACLFLAIFSGALGAARGGEPQSVSLSRIEVVPVESITISDEQFLSGEGTGKPTTVAGVLRLDSSARPAPLVIFIAGSGGFNQSVDVLSQQFEQIGISTFALDGFAARNIADTVSDQSQLGRLNMIVVEVVFIVLSNFSLLARKGEL